MSHKGACEDFGRWVWRNLAQVQRSLLPKHEESLTQFGLTRLWQESGLVVRNLTAIAEGKVGWDYELLIRLPGPRWYHYAVQAKRLYGFESEARYKGFKKEQLESILHHAPKSTPKIYPLYGFYNFVSDASPSDHWHCCEPFDDALLGVTIAPAWHLRRRRGAPKFDAMHTRSKKTGYAAVPLRCLFHKHPKSSHSFLPQHRNVAEVGVVPDSELPELEAWYRREAAQDRPDDTEIIRDYWPHRLRDSRLRGRAIIALRADETA